MLMFRNVTEEAVHRCGNGFAAVNAVARRAQQLDAGAPPLVVPTNREKNAMTALQEIASGFVEVCT